MRFNTTLALTILVFLTPLHAFATGPDAECDGDNPLTIEASHICEDDEDPKDGGCIKGATDSDIGERIYGCIPDEYCENAHKIEEGDLSIYEIYDKKSGSSSVRKIRCSICKTVGLFSRCKCKGSDESISMVDHVENERAIILQEIATQLRLNIVE